jgi:cell wall assembly regulator SMI1
MVEWINDSIDRMRPATNDEVKAAEEALGVRFPADFLAIAQPQQGVEPVPHQVDLPNGFTVSVDHLLPFSESAGIDNIVARRFPLEDVLDPKVVPFAEDTGGDLFCFDYGKGADTPSVGFWSTDTGLVQLAPDFTSFVASLHG